MSNKVNVDIFADKLLLKFHKWLNYFRFLGSFLALFVLPFETPHGQTNRTNRKNRYENTVIAFEIGR